MKTTGSAEPARPRLAGRRVFPSEHQFCSLAFPLPASVHRVSGKESKISLNVFPIISERDALNRRDEARKLLAAGINL